MSSPSAAAASERDVAQAARNVLVRGNAVDAVTAGLLVASAEHPAVLLGPLQVLVAGAGAGLRAIDGRVRQPGSGVPRPRGLLPGQEASPAYRVGVPAMPATLASMLASLGSQPLERLASEALERARASSPERARVLESFAQRGASTLLDEWLSAELTAVAGRSAGGQLTLGDLAAVRPEIVSCDERTLDPAGILTVPWGADPVDGSATQVIIAVDARGLTAIACYEASLEGLPVPALGLVAPAFACPVLRGQKRVPPGVPCSAAAPIVIRLAGGIGDAVVGVAQTTEADVSLREVARRLAEGQSLDQILAGVSAGKAVAVASTRVAARVLSTS